MRRKIIEEMIKEVYGPRNGPDEVIKSDPWKEYVTGVIIPQSWNIPEYNDPDSEIISSDETGSREDDNNDVEIAPSVPSQLDPKMRPKSFALSFVVNQKNPEIEICATWGRYFEDEDEDEKRCWIRKPFFKIVKVENTDKIILHEEDDGQIYIHIRRISWKDGNYHITISMVNDLDPIEEFRPAVSSCLFQPSLRLNLPEGTEIVDPSTGVDADEKLYFMYRNRPARARGHMCSALWKEIDYMDGELFDLSILWPDGIHFAEECSEFLQSDMRTEFIPLHPIPAPSFSWDDRYGEMPELSASTLSETWDAYDLEKNLMSLVSAYGAWIESNKPDPESDKEKQFMDEIIHDQSLALERITAGIQILKDDLNARLAFCFANRTIYLQNHWKNPQKDFKWRPFQLAFFLMNIGSIYSNDSSDRDILDLLWIPTGGGKTEAYMGIMAFNMALRRIKSRRGLSKEITGAGTAIFSRYTLRILTVQQFRRTLKMVTAAEYLRVLDKYGKTGWRPDRCSIKDDWIYGSSRFSAGMWVGGAVSPNHLRNKGNGAIDALMGKNGINGEPAQVINCPVCDSILSIPDSDLPSGSNTIHVVVKGNPARISSDKIKNLINEISELQNLDIFPENHKKQFFTLSISLHSESEIGLNELRDIWEKISSNLRIQEASLSFERPGYFGNTLEIGRRKKKFSDFEIWCPNPHCKINNNVSWAEGAPQSNHKAKKFPDQLYDKSMVSPFVKGTRIPITAYTVDEQIYSRCPTIIISTADKIARLSFEPRTCTLFGLVDKYNKIYGYRRDDLYPRDTAKASMDEDVDINPFLPPELIIQDELHLIDGPLGSMFGLYESVVDGIIKRSGGNPKYIASTATIKNAEAQVNLLFGKKLFQFPPHGNDIDDSFFVKESPFKEGWNKKQPGRVYMGIYAPGLGPMTPPVRIWSRALKTPFDNMDSSELKNFWTIVGYFNAIRELGGGRAIYREDIEERINDISDSQVRNLDQERVVELSSRIDSTSVPLVLSELENDGVLSEGQNHPFNDAIFTTSMFGTGVDISHLALMIVNGQPKTTGSYIQATGRIGRSHGGLVITFLRAGRPRDLSHYEMFCSYHQRIHLGVEPVTVSPYSDGALLKALGPAMVGYLRNLPDPSVKWYGEDGKVILLENSQRDLDSFFEILYNRLRSMENNKKESVISFLDDQIEKWKEIAENTELLSFVEYPWKLPQKDVVLGDSVHEHYEKEVVYPRAPQSLREIEETTGFRV